MTDRSIVHATFTIERRYAHAPAKVFRVFADRDLKRQWFGSPEVDPNAVFEFRVGGHESSAGEMGGTRFTYDALYQDIVPDNRIIYTYDMTMNGQRISVSIATLEFRADGSGTHFILREDGAYLDGLDQPAQREAGTNFMIDQIAPLLDRI